MAQAQDDRASGFVTRARQNARQLLEACENLLAMHDEWNALDYGNTLSSTPGAFVGSNAGLTKNMIGAAVFDTPNALTTLFAQGHATNLYSVK